jgi:Tfp pilus assembly protein PilZ
VKPENVLVTSEANSRVHLFDFGVAKIGPGQDIQQSKLTVSGAILGTPEYMASEALLSTPDADHRVDVYALGVTLYECLTGAVPFDGALGQILLKVATSEAPPLTDVRKDVPKALADVVARALRRDPADRFQSMDELGRALRACTQRPIASIDLLRRSPRPQVPPLPAQSAPAAPPRPGAASPPASAPQAGYEARRGHTRAPYVALASLERERGGTSDAKVEDISEGGVLVVAQDVYAAGETVHLRFGLPLSGRVLKVATTVRWVRTTRGTRATGLEFVNLPEAAATEIRQYVNLMGTSPPA